MVNFVDDARNPIMIIDMGDHTSKQDDFVVDFVYGNKIMKIY